jgi:type I protein arginine methyltransferase
MELGTIVEGVFHCRKSPDNSRELDVEVHYTFTHPSDGSTKSETVVQIYKVQ